MTKSETIVHNEIEYPKHIYERALAIHQRAQSDLDEILVIVALTTEWELRQKDGEKFDLIWNMENDSKPYNILFQQSMYQEWFIIRSFRLAERTSISLQSAIHVVGKFSHAEKHATPGDPNERIRPRMIFFTRKKE